MEEKRKPTRWELWLVVALVLLVGYPLSYGPMIFLTKKGWLPFWFPTLLLYKPLWWLFQLAPPLNQALKSYLTWWLKL